MNHLHQLLDSVGCSQEEATKTHSSVIVKNPAFEEDDKHGMHDRLNESQVIDLNNYSDADDEDLGLYSGQEGYIEELSTWFYLDTALLKSSENVLSET